jgi:hypothetical protein
MVVLQIYLTDIEYKRFKLLAKKHGQSPRKYAYKLLFRKANADLSPDTIAEIRTMISSDIKNKSYILKEYGISRYMLNKISGKYGR